MTRLLVGGQGMILTARTVFRGNEELIELWLATEQGPVKLLSPTESSVCFIKQTDSDALSNCAARLGLPVTITPVDLYTFGHEPVASVKLPQSRQLTQLRKAATEYGVCLFEADIKTPDRYLMERFVTLGVQYQGVPQRNSGTLTQARIKPAQYRCHLTMFSVDIECNEHGELFSIGIASTMCNLVLIIGDAGNKFESTESNPFEYVWCENEKALLDAFIHSVQHYDPDIFIGWNVKQFDFPVLHAAAKRHGMPLVIGREQTALDIRTFEDGRAYVDIPGRVIIDGIEGLKTMTYQFDNFTLDNVATQLLGKQKLITDTDKLGSIKRLFHEDKPRLAQYNFEDCKLVIEIADKVNLIDFLILRSELTGMRIGRPGGSVASFINLYLPKLHRAGYVSPNRPENGGLASPGGYVMSSKPGLYKHVLVLDFKSLYPSIIRTFKIDPLGLVEGLKHPDDAIPGFKGAVFHRENHFLPDIISSLWKQRDDAKQQKDAARSQAIKILMNSFYGVLGSGGCPFYDPRLASSITLRGHAIMQTTAQWIRECGYDVIYGDTDSTFVHLANCNSDSDAVAIGKQLQQDINFRWHQKIEQEYELECALEIEFETHFETFFMPTIRGSEAGSKKRYAGVIRKGDEAKLVFKGLESVRSDWTLLAKMFQETLYQLVFTEQPVADYISETVNNIREGKLDAQLVYTKQLRKPLAEYTKSVPPHVKAAKQADEQNQSLSKQLQYQKRTAVRYVMTTGGPQVPEYQTHPLDYDHYIEKQIRPIADSILPTIGESFDAMASQQIGLF